ncbi:hypothetical protein [Micromonospora sp. C41]|uniref:PD-(D/E)XK nuclease domain-containing protein n=1 Tax=Micromonospora TaxID=1873 RepID=UPI001B376529|nr:hypothetical protein [Micromonospora sp. C41]MBQ1062005.1 hypothetical protein [Micromonospora sp. C41]
MTAPDPGALVPVGSLLGDQLRALQEPLLRANLPGNLDGLLAHHLLGGRHLGFRWNVDPLTPAWLRDNTHRFIQAAGLAVLGYGLTAFPGEQSPAAQELLIDGMAEVMRRSPFQSDGVTFINDPGQLVGLALAANAVAAEASQVRTWLRTVLQDARLRPPTLLLQLFQEYARHLLDLDPAARPALDGIDDPVELAALHWVLTLPPRPAAGGPDQLRLLHSRLINAILLGGPRPVAAWRSALLIEAATRIVTSSIDDQLLSLNHVGVLLSRFEDAMRHWRYDTAGERPIRWQITSEREVQDILWMMLRPVFPDLVDEETLRKIGHSTYRADFGIPSLGLLIEVKYARKASDFKEFEQQIFIDYVAYLTGNGPYRKLAVFIYDESGSVQEYGTTRRALLERPNITDVVIVSRPSHVPVPTRQSRSRRSGSRP